MNNLLERIIFKIISFDRIVKQSFVLAIDMLLSIIASFFTFWLIFPKLLFDYNLVYLLCLFLYNPFYISFGLYQAIFRFSSLDTIKNVFYATFLYSLVLYIIISSYNLYYVK